MYTLDISSQGASLPPAFSEGKNGMGSLIQTFDHSLRSVSSLSCSFSHSDITDDLCVNETRLPDLATFSHFSRTVGSELYKLLSHYRTSTSCQLCTLQSGTWLKGYCWSDFCNFKKHTRSNTFHTVVCGHPFPVLIFQKAKNMSKWPYSNTSSLIRRVDSQMWSLRRGGLQEDRLFAIWYSRPSWHIASASRWNAKT